MDLTPLCRLLLVLVGLTAAQGRAAAQPVPSKVLPESRPCKTSAGLTGTMAWFSPPDDPDFPAGWEEVEAEISMVVASERGRAIEMLRVRSCVEVSAAEAKRLAGHEIVARDGEKLFLCRALCWPPIKPDSWAMEVHERGDVWIQSGFLGHPPKEPVKSPVLIARPREPKKVFVTVSSVL